MLRARRFYAYTEDYVDEETGEHVYVIKHWLKNYKIKRDIPLTEEALHIIDEAKKSKIHMVVIRNTYFRKIKTQSGTIQSTLV